MDSRDMKTTEITPISAFKVWYSELLNAMLRTSTKCKATTHRLGFSGFTA